MPVMMVNWDLQGDEEAMEDDWVKIPDLTFCFCEEEPTCGVDAKLGLRESDNANMVQYEDPGDDDHVDLQAEGSQLKKSEGNNVKLEVSDSKTQGNAKAISKKKKGVRVADSKKQSQNWDSLLDIVFSKKRSKKSQKKKDIASSSTCCSKRKTCTLSANMSCCACSDLRSLRSNYIVYVDGCGLTKRGPEARRLHYCVNCK